MLSIKFTTQFKKDFKREKKGAHAADVAALLKGATDVLVGGQALDAAYKDHPLKGDWKGWRDCHLKPDLVLIYCMTEDALELGRIGSHSELFG